MPITSSLFIGLWIADPRLRPYVRALLSLAEYRLPHRGRDIPPLTQFLEELLEQMQRTTFPVYDLLLQVPSTELAEDTRARLEQVATVGEVPILLLCDSPLPEDLPANVQVISIHYPQLVPILDVLAALEEATGASVSFEEPLWSEILSLQRRQIQQAIQAEQAWLHKRRAWMAQRHEWIEQRHTWLLGRLDWIEEYRRGPDPQHEWLTEQHA